MSAFRHEMMSDLKLRIRRFAPEGVWNRLRAFHYAYIRPLHDQIVYALGVASHRRIRDEAEGAFQLSEIANGRPNSGPIPYHRDAPSAAGIVLEMGSRRGRPSTQPLEGFEGFAPDDAVYDEATERWRIWSYASLATVLADCAYAISATPKVLELGCGSGHLGRFLKGLGIVNYIGIDGHPYFAALSSACRDNPRQFLTLNLQEEIRLVNGSTPVSFDVVCSFEVLEHIREDRIDTILATIRSHLHESGKAILSVSQVPQELCAVHVLVRPREWWLARFRQSGLVPSPDEPGLVPRLACHHPHNWSHRNSLIFVLSLLPDAATAGSPGRASDHV